MTTLASPRIRPRYPRRRNLADGHLAILRELAMEVPDLSSNAIASRLYERTGRVISSETARSYAARFRSEAGREQPPVGACSPARRESTIFSGDFRERVLEVCRALLARGVYPSVLKIQTELRSSHRSDVILAARQVLVDDGELVFPPRWRERPREYAPRQSPSPRGGLEGRTVAERHEIIQAALAIRQAALAAATKPQRLALKGRLLIDVLANRELDSLSPASACSVILRRTRRMRPDLWRGE